MTKIIVEVLSLVAIILVTAAGFILVFLSTHV